MNSLKNASCREAIWGSSDDGVARLTLSEATDKVLLAVRVHTRGNSASIKRLTRGAVVEACATLMATNEAST